MDLKAIETRAAEYAEARKKMEQSIDALKREIDRLKRGARPGIEKQIDQVALLRQELLTAIGENPHLFKKPKSRLFHGIKCGFRKLKGKIVYDDEAAVIARIKKNFPEAVDATIRTEEKVNKQALGEWTVTALRQIGAQAIDDSDEPFIKAADTDYDKWIESVLANDEEGAGDE